MRLRRVSSALGTLPVVGTILPKSAPPSIRSVASSKGTATPDSIRPTWLQTADRCLTGLATSKAKALIDSGGCCHGPGATRSARASTPRMLPRRSLSADCSYLVMGTKLTAPFGSTANSHGPMCSQSPLGLRRGQYERGPPRPHAGSLQIQTL